MASGMFLNNLISAKCHVFWTLSSCVSPWRRMEAVKRNRVRTEVPGKAGCQDQYRPVLTGGCYHVRPVVNSDLPLAAMAHPTDTRNRRSRDILEKHFDLTERNKKHFL